MADSVMLTEANQGQTIDLRLGQQAVLSLPENATTGYRWEIDRLDADMLAVTETRNYPSATVGSGGRVEWVFTPKRPGDGEVELKQWRPWEGERSVVARFNMRLHIGN